jgi:hypothetical protein
MFISKNTFILLYYIHSIFFIFNKRMNTNINDDEKIREKKQEQEQTELLQSQSNASPTSAILFFIIITLLYFLLVYYLKLTNTTIPFVIYLCSVWIGLVLFQLQTTSNLCGETQWYLSLTSISLPFVLLFLPITLVLKLYPGWLSPFSNTFGYGVALLAGIGGLMNNILKPQSDAVGKGTIAISESDKLIQENLAHIYSDRSLFLNEITLENFDAFWTQMSGLFKEGVVANPSLKDKLYQMVRLKTLVSEYIWYFLTGLLMTSMSYHSVLQSGCSLSAQEMKKRHERYNQLQKNASSTKQEQDQRVYSSHE